MVKDIQKAFKCFEPQKIRRVYIDKPGKAEKRPLGIPTIRDRIVQECIRIVLEPIFEAQFFAHSYGFRPMRDAAMALERIDIIMHNSGQYWIVEGDISKCFDRIDHTILLKRLYHMGVRDRRVLQIIKAMLKAGVMDECEVNEMNSFFDYVPGSATAEYRRCVDEAARIAGVQKQRIDPIHHEKIDRLLDTYARKLAENINQSTWTVFVPSLWSKPRLRRNRPLRNGKSPSGKGPKSGRAKARVSCVTPLSQSVENTRSILDGNSHS